MYIVDQVSAPSKETDAPPSLPSTILLGSRGSIHRSWLSLWVVVMIVKDRPPLSDLKAWMARIHIVSALVGWAKMWWW